MLTRVWNGINIEIPESENLKTDELHNGIMQGKTLVILLVVAVVLLSLSEANEEVRCLNKCDKDRNRCLDGCKSNTCKGKCKDKHKACRGKCKTGRSIDDDFDFDLDLDDEAEFLD